MELFDLTGRTAVVTGACGLLGVQHCEALLEAGATVIAADLNTDDVEALATSLGKGCRGFAVDVTSSESLVSLRDSILQREGQLDILVNNAAVNDMFENPELAGHLSQFEHYPLDSWKKSLDVNVTGVYLTSQILGTEMAKRGSGSIINVASTYGMVGPDQSIYKEAGKEQLFYKSPAYPATKGAVLNFTRFLAAYWGKKGVRVNSLSPGGVENGQDEWFIENYSAKTVLGRMAHKSDYRGAVVFLASDASAYMSGSNLVVDGGWTAM